MVYLSEIDFLKVVLEKAQDVFLPDAMDVVAISVMPLRTLKSVTKPTVRNPGRDFAVVFAQALLEITHRKAISDAAGVSEAFQFVHDRAFRTMQPLRDRGRRYMTDELLQQV